MKCPNCGKEIADESQFCNFCGAKVTNSATRKWIPLIAGALTFVIGLTVGLIMLFSKGNNNAPISRAEQAVRELEAAKSYDELESIENKYNDLGDEDFTDSQMARIDKVYEKFYSYEEAEAVTAATQTVEADPYDYDDPYWDSTAYEAVEAETVATEVVAGGLYDNGYVSRAEQATRAIEAATSMDDIIAIALEYQDLEDSDFTPEQQARMQKAVQKFDL